MVAHEFVASLVYLDEGSHLKIFHVPGWNRSTLVIEMSSFRHPFDS